MREQRAAARRGRASAACRRRAGSTFERGDGERDRDGEVDVEDQPPVGDLGEQPADEDADRRARAADRAPGCERLRPLRCPGRRS